jgi:hypothetical protein
MPPRPKRSSSGGFATKSTGLKQNSLFRTGLTGEASTPDRAPPAKRNRGSRPTHRRCDFRHGARRQLARTAAERAFVWLRGTPYASSTPPRGRARRSVRRISAGVGRARADQSARCTPRKPTPLALTPEAQSATLCGREKIQDGNLR